MRKEKLGRICLTIIPIIIFLIVFIETELYYQETISNRLYLLFLSIMNGLRIFATRSTIDILDIIQKETASSGPLRQIFDTLYVLCYFGAPIVTVNCFVKIYNYLAKEKLINVGKNSKKERVVIFGYNKHVEVLIENIIDSNKEQKKKILVLHKNEIEPKQKFKFQRSGVLFKQYGKLDFSEEIEENGFDNVIKELWGWVIPKRVKDVHIILFEEKEMDNLSNYCFFLKCLESEYEKEKNGKKNRLKNLRVRVDCNYVLPQVEQLIWKCFEKTKELFEYRMNTFSLPMLRAQSVLEKHSICENIIFEKKECKDIHLLIIGFGKMGQRFLQRAVNQSIVSEKNKIIVDIVEKDMDKAKWCLEKMCENFYDSEENIVHVGPTVAEGDLKIRLHGININNSRFKECLERISHELPFTYIAICIDNPDDSISCMFSVEDFLQVTNQKCPVMLRMDSGQKLGSLENIYEGLHMVPGDDDIITLENICNQNYSEIDVNIHKRDKEKQKQPLAYQIESRKYRVLHYDTKNRVYNSLATPEKEHIKKVFQSEKYTEKEKRDEFIDAVKNDTLLWKLGAIEHRRWSYYMILHGWTQGKERDAEKKTTPYLRPFAEIIKDSTLKKSVYYEYKDWNEISITNKAGEETWRIQHGKK